MDRKPLASEDVKVVKSTKHKGADFKYLYLPLIFYKPSSDIFVLNLKFIIYRLGLLNSCHMGVER